jgi:hypothetical protein
MPDFETFVIAVYVMVDDFQHAHLPPEPVRPGPRPGLCRSEVLTLALIAQPARFPSERAFARFARAHLRGLFPGLPGRSQLHRLVRRQRPALVALGRWAARRLGALTAPFEALDTTAVPVRNVKRRGAGALPEAAAVGYSPRLGWFEGFRLLLAVTDGGAVTGWGLAPGNAQDRALAETFFAQRAAPAPALPSVGRPASGAYLADTGFAGRAARARWAARYDAHVYAPPQPDSGERWPRALRRWHAAARQVVETVVGRLQQGLGLERVRPRTLDGLLTRIAAKVALHNLLIRWNRQAGRPDLALEEVVGW